ncbi:DUF4124 domain-containing protein [Dechloromonas sp. HYN0024]|uniref:DUF4124 domain-containing protein n=1 Tax=Dechloromonas sp. HYN0024 TaxID=2231055 RepID=UPI0013C2AEBF|nr:DUF4124 domain-containing protein [Dechloromonas sp. HYN0024]
MRYPILFVLLLCANPSHAAVFTCHTRSGEIVYSDIPCDKGATIEKVSPSESISDPDAARRELERQKAYAATQAAENARARAAAPGPAILPDYASPPPSWPAPTPLSPASTGQSATPPNTR